MDKSLGCPYVSTIGYFITGKLLADYHCQKSKSKIKKLVWQHDNIYVFLQMATLV